MLPPLSLERKKKWLLDGKQITRKSRLRIDRVANENSNILPFIISGTSHDAKLICTMLTNPIEFEKKTTRECLKRYIFQGKSYINRRDVIVIRFYLHITYAMLYENFSRSCIFFYICKSPIAITIMKDKW